MTASVRPKSRGEPAPPSRPTTPHDRSSGERASFDRQERFRRRNAWFADVRAKLRGDFGRTGCKKQRVSHRLVADLADELTRYPSFLTDGTVYAGQARLATRLGVHERQLRRAVAVLVDLKKLRTEQSRRGQNNVMTALLNDGPLFDAAVSEMTGGYLRPLTTGHIRPPARGHQRPTNLQERKKRKIPPP